LPFPRRNTIYSATKRDLTMYFVIVILKPFWHRNSGGIGSLGRLDCIQELSSVSLRGNSKTINRYQVAVLNLGNHLQRSFFTEFRSDYQGHWAYKLSFLVNRQIGAELRPSDGFHMCETANLILSRTLNQLSRHTRLPRKSKLLPSVASVAPCCAQY
jgi:hypothetical protein